MDIQFSSAKLERIFNSDRQLLKEYGRERAGKIRLRMSVLKSAKNLAEVPKKRPDRCHGLQGDRAGQYTVDLNNPFRLVFEPVGTPSGKKAHDPITESAVTAIRILKVEDYH